ncbi:MAG: hypothetical protein R2991_09700 [Thermoanaerobaculia bacterium]
MNASGGNNPQVEHLLEMLEARVGEEGEAGGETATAPTLPAPTQEAPARGPSAPEGESVYRLTIRLAPGAQPPPGAVLFVTLRGDAPGPPAAVQRIAGATFPLEVTLSAGDSMLGRPLPESGTVGARLDGDGNAMSREEGDPSGRQPRLRGSLSPSSSWTRCGSSAGCSQIEGCPPELFSEAGWDSKTNRSRQETEPRMDVHKNA